jgi:hypothetical protein
MGIDNHQGLGSRIHDLFATDGGAELHPGFARRS